MTCEKRLENIQTATSSLSTVAYYYPLLKNPLNPPEGDLKDVLLKF